MGRVTNTENWKVQLEMTWFKPLFGQTDGTLIVIQMWDQIQGCCSCPPCLGLVLGSVLIILNLS